MLNIFKEASRLKLRFVTPKGELSVEQLWTLDLPTLDALAVSLEEQFENSKGKSFITKKSSKDKTVKLQFDVVFEILTTKMEEAEIATTERENNEFNQTILNLIAEKQTEELKGLSIDQLKKKLKK